MGAMTSSGCAAFIRDLTSAYPNMFSKIPQRFSAPFGLLGDEAKLAFPSQPGGITKLSTVRNIPKNDGYWDQYFTLFDSASDVFSLITSHHIRRALLDAPENIATLIHVVCIRLFNLISDHTFPTASTSASVTAFASSIIKTGTSSAERNATKEVLNCLRILQRVLPVIFEVQGESNVFETELLWKREEVDEVAEEAGDEPQFVIEDEDEDQERDSRLGDSQPSAKKQLPSLGERLFGAVVDLMFCCGFTLPSKIQVDHHKISYLIWEKGIGSTLDTPATFAYDNNKTEVLRLLLVLLSRQIYVPPGSLFTKPSLYSIHLVQKTARRDVLTILCSLLNTAMNSSTAQDMSLGAMAGKLPYNHLVFKGEDPRVNLVGICFQVLCVLLDFQSGTARDIVTGSGETQTSAPTARTNAFRYFLMKLHRDQDFEFIITGIVGILEQQMTSVNKLLPGSKKALPYVTETIIFFWKMIELNKKFRVHVLQSQKSTDLVAYLLCYCVEIKDKPQQHGLCRAISYIIQTLSAEVSFGLRLSTPVTIQLPTKWNSAGSVGDFIINATYAIIATTSGNLNSLYPALIIALSNLAPYFKGLNVAASNRLVQLFGSFSNPLFLLSDEGHPRLLFFMLEVLNSIALHNLAENPNLIYGILSSHKIFEDLGTFTLARGLREIKRVQLAKEEQAKKLGNDPNGKSKSSVDEAESETPGAEKARLLESETRNNSIDEPVPLVGGTPRQSDEIVTRSFMSPSSDAVLSPISEKARGKMKERRSSSIDTNSSLERIAAAGIGRNGFIPTQEWVTSWQQGLPLDTVMLLISELLPKVQELQTSRKANSTAAVVDFLSNVTLKHVLPATPPIIPRSFVWSDASMVWLTSLIWGEVYVRGMSPLNIWNGTNVRLFYVKHTQNQRQLTDTVSTVVGGFLRRNTDLSQSRPRAG